MVPCCLGENLGDCNKTCVQTTGLKGLTDFAEEKVESPSVERRKKGMRH